eukprot:jgi/Psemu1/52940/gm1.52940_g
MSPSPSPSQRPSKPASAVLQFQTACQQNGWGFLSNNNNNNWTLDVFYAPKKCKRFVVPVPRTAKIGKSVVSENALREMAGLLALEESKRTVRLADVFPGKITILDSDERNTWERFWTNPPTEVGIDCEGNQISPPVLVQVSTEDYTILEAPRNGRLSDDLQRLLDTESIVKVFCDNFSDQDKVCLGLLKEKKKVKSKEKSKEKSKFSKFSKEPAQKQQQQQRRRQQACTKSSPSGRENDCRSSPNSNSTSTSKSDVADIEMMSRDVIGPTNTPRGLSKLLYLCYPELNVRIEKAGKSRSKRFKLIGRFVAIEQGK